MDNPQDYQHMHAQGGQPYAATGGIARSLGYLRALVPQAIVLAACVIVAEAALPPGAKPSTLLGHFHGSLDTAEISAKQGAVVGLEQDMTTARTAPPATYQMEAQVAAQQQQAVAEALQGQAGMANLADTLEQRREGDDGRLQPARSLRGAPLHEGAVVAGGLGERVRHVRSDSVAHAPDA